MPVQNVIGSAPIVNVQPPLEGTMAASVDFVLTPTEPSITQLYQLSSQGGLMISQVVTICVDNSENAYPLLVTHGVLGEVVQVAAYSTAIIPTLSNKSGYPITVATLNNILPAVNLNVTVIFLNYPRTPGTFDATTQTSIIATNQNTGPLFSSLFNINPSSVLVPLLIAGNYILDSLDMAIEGAASTVNNSSCYFSYTLSTTSGVNIQSGFWLNGANSSNFSPGAQVNGPAYRTWPQGLVLPRGDGINFTAANFNQLQDAIVRVSFSGLSTP
jgi:hypothetical protein